VGPKESFPIGTMRNEVLTKSARAAAARRSLSTVLMDLELLGMVKMASFAHSVALTDPSREVLV
jgi:hypothetical protein